VKALNYPHFIISHPEYQSDCCLTEGQLYWNLLRLNLKAYLVLFELKELLTLKRVTAELGLNLISALHNEHR